MVFAGLYPIVVGRLRGPARRGRQAAPERRLVLLRAGELGRPRLRLPLRLPRAAPHGDHPGAAGARVQPRPHHHRARACAIASHTTDGETTEIDSPASCRPRAASTTSRSPTSAPPSSPADEYVGGILALAEERRGEQQSAAVPDLGPRADRVRLPARRGDPRLLRPAEVGVARLRLVRLRAGRLPAERAGRSSTSWSTASRSMRCR